jgi:hypothetical protein
MTENAKEKKVDIDEQIKFLKKLRTGSTDCLLGTAINRMMPLDFRFT